MTPGGGSMFVLCQSMLTSIVFRLSPPIVVSSFLIICFAAAFSPAQTQHPESTLKQYYDAAQHFQQLGDMQQSAREYRAFLSEALGELAAGYALQGNTAKASSLFDETVALTPNDPRLLLNAAQAAFANAEFDHAQSLAQRLIDNQSSGVAPVDKKTEAEAYQVLGRALLKKFQDKEARKALEKAVDLDPSFDNGYALAVTCLDMDDDKCADQLFSEMETSFGDKAILHLEFGLAYGQSDFPQRAIDEFKKAIAEDSRLPKAHYSLAAAYLDSAQSDSLQKAEVELKKELEISPNDFLTYAALGHVEVARQQYAEAEKNLKRAVALNPQNPDAYLYLGQMYYETDRFADAEPALREAIQHTTDVSRNRYQVVKAHYLLGRLLARSGRRTEAEAEMKIAQQFMSRTLTRDRDRLSGKNPDQTAAAKSSNSAIAMATVESPDQEHRPNQDQARGGPQNLQALVAFEKQITGPVADSYNNLGVIAAGNKDYPAALNDFQRAYQWNPTLDGLDYNWGRAAFLSAHFQDAVPPLTRYLRAHPGDSGIRPALALSLFMTGDYDAVVRTLQPVLSTIDKVPQVEFAYADSLIRTGKLPEGIARLQSLERQNPQVPDVHRALGEAYAQSSPPDLAKAFEELNAASRINPTDPQTHYDLGKLDLQQGNDQAAIPELETAVQLKPSDCAAHSELAVAYRQASRSRDAEREEKYCGQRSSAQQQPSLP